MMKLWARGVRVAVFFLSALSLQSQTTEFRGVWVDAWGTGFLDAGQVTQLISDCRAYNFNAVVVQMRRRGDAFYTPGITGNDPKTTAISSGFDALADIIAKAHSGSPRIEVHCWVTTFPVWGSATPPSQPGHVFNLHPEYLMLNSTGTNWIGEGYYLDPGNPDATLWNFVMATNITRRYEIDGFHWDYIRYPAPDSGYNPVAIARYNAEFGVTGQPAFSSTQFSNWRRRQVTDFLRWVNAELLSIRPSLQISCAVFGSRSDAYNARFQDWAAWNGEGIIDLCMPMNYTPDNALFQARVDDAYNNQGIRRVYNGPGGYMNTKENSVYQLLYARNKPLLGSVLYSYRTCNSGTVDQAGTLSYIRDNYQPTWVDAPPIPWKTAPTRGIARGRVSRSDSGAAIYNASVQIFTAPPRTQLTEAHGAFAFFETTPGTFTITATAPGLGSVTNTVVVTAGGNVSVNLVVPATDNTPPVLSNIAVSGLTDTAATIAWATDETANSAVDYGPTVSYGSVATNSSLVLSHSLTLAGLTPNTTYHYRVRSRNAAGLQAVSADRVFTTNPAGVVNDVIVESRGVDGSLTSNPPYSDAGFSDSALKSSAAGLTGTGSRYAGSGTPSYTLRPTLPLSGGTYDVYLTHGYASSVSDDIVVGISQTGCSGLPATTTIHREPGYNTWEYLGRLTLNAGVTVPTLTFSWSSGVLSGTSRMYSDSAKFVYVTPPQPPLITSAPPPRTVNQGASTTFTVVATGAAPLSYRWRFEGSYISGASASSYNLSSVQPIHEGDYSVVITNVAGSVTSAPAFLAVNVPPTIATPPLTQSVRQGSDAMFSVEAAGTEPLSFQWRFYSTNLAGATENTLELIRLQPFNAGPYSVLVTNLAGSITSSVALLTVVPPVPPVFQSITMLPDGRARLRLAGETNIVYTLEASTDFASWFDLFSATNLDGILDLIDDTASNAPARLYRARE